MDIMVVMALGVFALVLALAVGTAVIAQNKGRSAVGWFFLSILATVIVPFGGVILIFVIAFMARVEQPEPQAASAAPTPSSLAEETRQAPPPA